MEKINNTGRHKRKESKSPPPSAPPSLPSPPSPPDYWMWKWHANTMERNAFIHWLAERRRGRTDGSAPVSSSAVGCKYIEKEKKVWEGPREQRLKLRKTQPHSRIKKKKSTKGTSGERTANVVHVSKTLAH